MFAGGGESGLPKNCSKRISDGVVDIVDNEGDKGGFRNAIDDQHKLGRVVEVVPWWSGLGAGSTRKWCGVSRVKAGGECNGCGHCYTSPPHMTTQG